MAQFIMVAILCKHRDSGGCTIFRAMLAACLLALWASNSFARVLTISLNDVRAAGATLYVAVYSTEDGQGSWQQEPYRTLKLTLPEAATAEFELDLPDGRYALRAYVDIDGSGELETARFNRPLEPFTLSSATHQDKPSVHFRNAVFVVDEQNQSLQLTLFYPEGTGNDEPLAGND